jgi:hypothetical protein
VRRRPTGELPTGASGTSERPIPLGLCLKCRVIRKNADRTSCATVRELPPQLYGGTERVVSYLTEELVRQGHKVTLFASGDSQTTATLRAPCERALRLDPQCKDPLPYHFI